MTGDPFVEHRDRPSPDTLVGLLRASQDSVYRLCYHVLQNAHDAEDAAQQVLLKIVDARRFEDRDQYHRWLYRVSLNAALEAARKAARRRAYESRAAMERTEPVTLKPEQRLVVFEALAALDDVSRAFLLQHYFEGQPLETIAAQSGYTPSGVSRRMEKARESMRRRLGGVAAFPALESLFPPIPPPPDLVTGTVLAKAAAVGGTLMASKSSIAAIVAFALIACLGVGTGTVLVFRAQETSKPASTPLSGIDTKTPASAPNEKRSPVAVDEGTDRGVSLAAAKRRILEAYAKHYPKLNTFAAVKKDPTAGVYLRALIETKELKSLAALLTEDESGSSLTALRELFDSSKSDLRHFTLLLLVQGGRPEFESFLLGIMKGDSSVDPVGRALAAFGLGNIASPSAMNSLIEGFRSGLHAGKADYTFVHALCLRPALGLPHLVVIAEELLAMGRSPLQEFRSMGGAFPCEPAAVEQLRMLAETHSSPAVRMLALRPLIGLMRSKDDLMTLESALGREKDPAVRADILRMTHASVLRGELATMEGEARRLLAQVLVADLGSDQGARLKVCLKLVPEDEIGLAREVLLGKPAQGVDVEKLDAILFEELPTVRSAEARRMMQDYALKMGVEDCLSPLVVLTGGGPLTEERLIAPLIDLVQRVEAGKSRAHVTSAIIALSGFAEEFRPRILVELENILSSTRKPEVRTAVLEFGFARMGPAGEERLIKEAGSSADPSCRIASWNLLQRTGALDRKTELQAGAKRFIESWNPPDEGVTAASRIQSRSYAELFSSIYMKSGTVEDLPMLRRVAEKPALAGADARVLESLGQSAAAAIELIEVRTRLN